MINEKQEKKLYELLNELSSNDYYKNQIHRNDFNKGNIWQYYLDIPFIKKQEILDNLEDYISIKFKAAISSDELDELLKNVVDLSNNHDKQIIINNDTWHIEFTTGSTGKPFPIIKSPKTRMLESIYLHKKRKCIYPLAKVNNGFLFLHSSRKDILSMNLWAFLYEDMKYIVDSWINNPPKWIFATPLIFDNYARLIKKMKPNLFYDNKLKFIEYTSQHFNDDQRDLISETFNCPVISNYGSREFWNIAYQCPYGNMHVNNDYLIINLIDEEGNIINEYNKTGDVIVTNLINSDMPLLKYYLGDRARMIESRCECGCDADIIQLMPERENEKLKNTPYYGSKVFRRVMRGIYFHDFFEDIKKIKIIQDEAYHLTVYLDKIKINDRDFEEKFVNRTHLIVPEFDKFKVDFEYNFPYENEEFRFKEIIFKSII